MENVYATTYSGINWYKLTSKKLCEEWCHYNSSNSWTPVEKRRTSLYIIEIEESETIILFINYTNMHQKKSIKISTSR